jgi:hypothetical protein
MIHLFSWGVDLVAAEHLRVRSQRSAVHTAATQMGGNGPLRDMHLMVTPQNVRDRRRGTRHGNSTRDDTASSNNSRSRRTPPLSDRSFGATPPGRHARSHRSTVLRE